MENTQFEMLMANLFLIAGLFCSAFGADWIYWALFTGLGFLWLVIAMLGTYSEIKLLDFRAREIRRLEEYKKRLEEMSRRQNEKPRRRN